MLNCLKRIDFLTKLVNMQYSTIKELERKQKESRLLWHDMMGHIASVKAYLQAGRPTDALNYLFKIDSMTRDIVSYYMTGYPVLDMVLNERKDYCQSRGICFELLTKGFDLCEIEDIDICIIFGNLINNAVEACEGLPEGERSIKVEIVNTGLSVAIRISNTMNPHSFKIENDRFITTKANSRNHGVGLNSVEKAAEKYGGKLMCALDTKRCLFNASVKLYPRN